LAKRLRAQKENAQMRDFTKRARLTGLTLGTIGLAGLAALLATGASGHGIGMAPRAVLPSFTVPYGDLVGDPTHDRMIAPVLVAATTAEPDAGEGLLVDAVRAANARFADVKVALAEGYSPLPCTSGVDGGAMGVHYVNSALIGDPAVEIGKPEAVMYEPQADGSMQLVAVEYITAKGPAQLGGQLFAFNGAPNRYGLPPFYELHVWAFRDNPKGTYSDMNPNVSCEMAHEQSK